ncbi:MAG: SMI1/KNR4 family protein [Planctomycetia bacterium]|nr:SMI1/KNR4 family protein [Planctomycetia bacterium]
MISAIDNLHKLMPPPAKPTDATGSWEQVERELDTRLPDDYKQFVQSYGSGNIGDMPLTIHNPFAPEPGLNLLQAAKGIVAAYKSLVDDGYKMRYRLFPESGGLLPWGTTGNGDYLHWRTKGLPEQWSVVIWDCGLTKFRSFENMNCVQFLTELISGRLKVFPSAFFETTPKFVQYIPPSDEQKKRRK